MMSQNTTEHAKQTDFPPGTKVDHYRIIRSLGTGGMAQVYLARDTALGRNVALNIIHPKRIGKKDAVERFLFEAKGTPAYMAPEQGLAQKLGPAADIWALGISMHEMLAGQNTVLRAPTTPKNKTCPKRLNSLTRQKNTSPPSATSATSYLNWKNGSVSLDWLNCFDGIFSCATLDIA